MTQLNLFGDPDQQHQKPAKKAKERKPKTTYSSPTIVIIDRRTNINFKPCSKSPSSPSPSASPQHHRCCPTLRRPPARLSRTTRNGPP